MILDSGKNVASSITTDTELSYVHGVTSSIQDQLNSKIDTANILGTTNQINITPSGSDIIISISNNPILPGTGAVTLPQGTQLQRAGGAGSMRFNTDFNVFEATSDGTHWATIETSSTGVTSVNGTAGQIDVSPTTGNCVVSIDPSYVGQTSITTLGTVSTGSWHGSIISPTYGGTGINNSSSTLTLSGSLVTSGSYSSTFTMTGPTSVTFPTSGTLATTSTANVASVSGTVGKIDVSPTTGNCVVTIDPSYVGQTSITTLGTVSTGSWHGSVVNPTYGGTGVNNGSSTLTLAGNLATSGAYASTFTMTGPTSVTFPTSGTLATTSTANVASVSGTAGQIDVSPTTGNCVVSIDPGYVGQTSITTLGTITIGTWDGSVISPTYGGTGVNNGSSTLTLAGNLATSGVYASTFTMTAPTSVTFPTSGTLMSTTLTDSYIFVGSASNVATGVPMSNDATLGNSGALTLATVNSNTGTWGSATQVPQFTVNGKGLVTAVSNVNITGTSPVGSSLSSGDIWVGSASNLAGSCYVR